MSAAAALLGLALLIGAGPTLVRNRAWLRSGGFRQRRRSRRQAGGPLAVGSSFDVLAVCLSAGMTVSSAAAATVPSAPPQLAPVLQRAADLLALGADPAAAWTLPPGRRDGGTDTQIDTQIDALLRLARRSACSGATLADGVAELAAQCRHDAAQSATAAAERAGVLIAGPLGLCFLPAFVCLGIIPTIAGLAGELFASGLV